ncbi:FHA domain-containing protein [Thalassoroseus pseudoceratinae]|uniref:FHA domain-containing protein n=1 Tax=Thalassoroseus pseudoceratinae TaxID=2713176 RepID=UPI001421B07A|nr:FHA domain-containing protein [Thalassoroseus pseudoceratinae]
MPPSDPIRINDDDLFSDSVEDYLDVQDGLRRELHDTEPQPLFQRIFFSSWFYLSLASGLGAFIAWLFIVEPLIDDVETQRQFIRRLLYLKYGSQFFSKDLIHESNPFALLIFPAVTGGVGLFLGAAEGVMCRNLRRAALSGLIGLAIGFFGGAILSFPSGLIYGTMEEFSVELDEEIRKDEGITEAERAWATAEQRLFAGEDYMVVEYWLVAEMTRIKPAPKKFAFLLQMIGRSLAWAICAIAAGLGQGIATKSKKVVLNGVVGGVLGGLLGGMLFDPIDFLLAPRSGEADVSRMVGFTLIGLFVGLFVGLVEGWTKSAWLLMRQGPLAGKQFVLFRDTTTLGSSPKADVYLFKDEVIEPEHATITNRGGRFEIVDLDTPDGTYVNGQPIRKHILQTGDQISLGRTVLEFTIKEQ